MKWQEVIKLRFAEGDREAVDRVVTGFVGGIARPEGLERIDLLRQLRIAGDLCVVIHWEKPEAAPQGSLLGQTLVHLLGELGLTHHSVWIEQEAVGTPPCGRTAGAPPVSQKGRGVGPASHHQKGC